MRLNFTMILHHFHSYLSNVTQTVEQELWAD
nr:MAG TPA: hypothetical protein [Caudoviricetes sp.]